MSTHRDDKPLHGCCIVLTRPEEQSRRLAGPLESAGASIFYFPTMHIVPIEPLTTPASILANIEQYDGILFTSQHAVHYFLQAIPSDLLSTWQQTTQHPTLICIGKRTAESLASSRLTTSHTAIRSTAEDLLEELLQSNVANRRYLFPCSLQARTELPRGLQQAGAAVDIWHLYQPQCANTDPESFLAKLHRNEVDIVVVLSPSAVRFLFQMIDPHLLQNSIPEWIAIGPTTAQELQQHDIIPNVAEPPGIQGVLRGIMSSEFRVSGFE